MNKTTIVWNLDIFFYKLNNLDNIAAPEGCKLLSPFDGKMYTNAVITVVETFLSAGGVGNIEIKKPEKIDFMEVVGYVKDMSEQDLVKFLGDVRLAVLVPLLLNRNPGRSLQDFAAPPCGDRRRAVGSLPISSVDRHRPKTSRSRRRIC